MGEPSEWNLYCFGRHLVALGYRWYYFWNLARTTDDDELKELASLCHVAISITDFYDRGE